MNVARRIITMAEDPRRSLRACARRRRGKAIASRTMADLKLDFSRRKVEVKVEMGTGTARLKRPRWYARLQGTVRSCQSGAIQKIDIPSPLVTGPCCMGRFRLVVGRAQGRNGGDCRRDGM